MHNITENDQLQALPDGLIVKIAAQAELSLAFPLQREAAEEIARDALQNPPRSTFEPCHRPASFSLLSLTASPPYHTLRE